METTTEQYKFADLYPEEAGKLAQKLHIKKDEIPFIRKYYIKDETGDEKDTVSKKDRTIISRISCVEKDRDGESLLPSGVKLENYLKNPVVCWGHSYKDPTHFIGKNLWIKQDENGLIAKTAFAKNEFADQVFRAYTEDIAGTGPLLRGFSVGFIPLKYEDPETKGNEDGPKRIFTEWELLEYSCVGIPCSPSSLTLAYEKGVISERFKDKIEKEYEIKDFQTDPDMEKIDFEPEEETEVEKIFKQAEKSMTIDDVLADRLDEIEAKDADDLGDVSKEEIKAAVDFSRTVTSAFTAEEEAEREPDDQADIAEAGIITIQELRAILADVKELLSKPDDDPEFTIEPDDDPEVTIEPDESTEPNRSTIADIVKAELANLDLAEVIRTEVSNTIKRLKGRVE